MKKLLSCILSLCMLLGLTVCATAEQPAANGDIVVLYTNDIHCAIDGKIGFTGVATLKQQLQKEGNAVILADAGDAIQGDVVGTLSKGEYIIDLMNVAGYDIATPGNHEYDYGMERFFELVEKANFPYVSCNFVDLRTKTNAPVFAPYHIFEAAGKKLAFVGITTPKTITSSTPTFFQNEAGEYIYGFLQDADGKTLYAAVQAAVDSAKGEGADYVIALAHLGIEEGCAPYMSNDVIMNTTGIDVVIDGHSHSTVEYELVKNKENKEVILTQTGTKLAAIGKLTITADGKLSTTLVRYADPATDEAVAAINDGLAETLNQVVAKTEVPLAVMDPASLLTDTPVRIVRNLETNLGDLCADAYRYIAKSDIAFVNGGGVRADIPAGDITYAQIISVHPFGNELCLVEVTGQQVLDALEMGSRNAPGESGGFLQVSGLTFELHTYLESGVQLDENGMFTGVTGDYRVKNVKVGEEALDLEKTYTLASHNYMLKSAGDGFAMFKGANLLLDSVMLDNQVLINYIIEGLNGVVGDEYADPYGDDRIIIVAEAPAN